MIALKTKDKLCFINAKCAKPEPYYENYEKQSNIDSMLTSQILDTLSKDLVEVFVCITSTKNL